MVRASDVFGVNVHSIPLSYVSPDCEEEFKEAIEGNEFEVIVLFGLSKVGKTTLRRHVLPEESYTFIEGAPTSTTMGCYLDLLDQANVINEEQETVGTSKGGVGSIGIPLGAKVEGGLISTSTSTTSKFGIDPSNPTSVARKFMEAGGKTPIFIDNFNYMDANVQRELAYGFRTFAARGAKNVVIGTWSDPGYIQNIVSDTKCRVKNISYPEWTIDKMQQVISKGEEILNVELSDKARKMLINQAHGNIVILQKCLLELMKTSNVKHEQKEKVIISDLNDVNNVLQTVSKQAQDDVLNLFEKLAKIGQNNPLPDKQTRMFKIITAILSSHGDFIENGIPLDNLFTLTNQIIIKNLDDTHQIQNSVFRQLIKTYLTNDQSDEEACSDELFFTYNDSEDTLVISDSWLKFAMKYHRPTLRSRIMNFA